MKMIYAIRVIIYAVLIAMSAPFFWQLVTGGESMVVTGASMRPTYEIGDVVFIEKVNHPDSDFWVKGEVVAVAFSGSDLDENRYIHRVHRVLDGGRAILKGDGNPKEDVSPVELNQVVGVPVGELHGVAAGIYRYTQDWVGRLIIFGCGIGLLIVAERFSAGPKRLRYRRSPSASQPLAPPESE